MPPADGAGHDAGDDPEQPVDAGQAHVGACRQQPGELAANHDSGMVDQAPAGTAPAARP